MKLLWRIAKFALVTIYALCGLALLLFLVPATGFEAKEIATGSMRPAIPPGSLVIIHKTPLNQLKVGNVVTYTKSVNPPVTITHRIVKTETKSGAPYFIVKGDANPAPDPAVPGGLIVGKVIFHAPYIGRVAIDMRNPVVIVIIVIIPGLLIIADEIIRLRKAFGRPAAQKSEPTEPPAPPATKAKEAEVAVSAVKKPVAVPARRRTMDGMKPRQLVVTLAALSMVAFGVKTTYAEIASNAVTISDIKLSTGGGSGSGSGGSPSPSPSPTTPACPSGDILIQDTGAGSINIIDCKNKKTGKVVTIIINNIDNSNSQSSSSGNVNSSGNTNSGNTGSGNSSNSNSTTTTVNNNKPSPSASPSPTPSASPTPHS